jgi:hypothetical protein
MERVMKRRLLVIANQTVECDRLDELVAEVGATPEVLVVAPVLARRRIDYWTGDDRRARRDAAARLAVTVQRLRSVGVNVEGALGDPDPLLAIEDALREFPADEIVVLAHEVPDLREPARPPGGVHGRARKTGRAPLKPAQVTVDKRARGAPC